MTMFPPVTPIACGTAAVTLVALGLVTAACGVAVCVPLVVAAVGFAPANWTKFPFKLITEIKSPDYKPENTS